MSFKNLLALNGLFPKEIFKVRSKFNGEIKITEKGGRRSLLVAGLSQSGPLVQHLWQQGLQSIKRPVENVLILGLGTGSAVKPIKKFWPKAEIYGVEIDPEIISLGERYFGLSPDEVTIILADALKIASKKEIERRTFDLILVDLFLGDKFPKQAEAREYLQNLKHLLSKNGLMIFNRLFFGRHRRPTIVFKKRLEEFFGNVTVKTIPWLFPSNLLIFCSPN